MNQEHLSDNMKLAKRKINTSCPKLNEKVKKILTFQSLNVYNISKVVELSLQLQRFTIKLEDNVLSTLNVSE